MENNTKYSAVKFLEVEKLEVEKGNYYSKCILNDDKNTEIGNPNIDGAIVEAKF